MMRPRPSLLSFALLAAAFAAASCGRAEPAPPAAVPPVALTPAVTTDAVTDDADDPAIWIHPTDPARSLIVGTNKVAAPAGAVVVFGLDGRTRQTLAGIDRPNNVDVEYGIAVGGRTIDIAVVTERLAHRLRVFEIEPAAGRLVEHAQVPVLVGEAGERAEPMGLALYKRPTDGVVFAIVAPKTGGSTDYLAQYRLADDGTGRITGTLVRRFGNFRDDLRDSEGGIGEIEAVVVDDELGYVYYSDEFHGIRKWHADPDHADAVRELAVFGTGGYVADREGLAIYPTGPGTGYLVSTDQIEGGSVLKFYAREGSGGGVHDHSRVLFEVKTPADATDGLEVTSRALPAFPDGLAVLMNSTARNFLVFDWRDLQP
jgi:3-phytase